MSNEHTNSNDTETKNDIRYATLALNELIAIDNELTAINVNERNEQTAQQLEQTIVKLIRKTDEWLIDTDNND